MSKDLASCGGAVAMGSRVRRQWKNGTKMFVFEFRALYLVGNGARDLYTSPGILPIMACVFHSFV